MEKITQDQLRENIKFQLQAFNSDKTIQVDDDTVISHVVKPNDGPGSANSQNIFQQLIKWTIINNYREARLTEKPKRWPVSWTGMTVTELASKLIVLLLFISLSFGAAAQLELSIGTIKTDSRAIAIDLGITYVRSLDSLFKNSDFSYAGKHSMFTVTPAITVRTGTVDAFSTVDVKATGLLTSFRTTTVAGIKAPDTRKTFHVFPFSIGAEADNTFQRINGIVEVGWVPWYWSESSARPDVIKRTRFGLFLQGGQKFYKDSTGDRSIARAKGNFTIDTKKLLSVQGLNFGLAGSADGWYNFLQQEFYYRLVGKGRIYLSDGKYFDLEYQRGSGAPNFFEGDQYGVNLTITF